MEVLHTFSSGAEQTVKALSFSFTFCQNVFCVIRGQESQLTAEHCYLPKTFLVGICCILKYTKDTSHGKVAFNPLLALGAKAVTDAGFTRVQVYFFSKDSALIYMKCILTLSL